jgi:hypothetical protein
MRSLPVIVTELGFCRLPRRPALRRRGLSTRGLGLLLLRLAGEKGKHDAGRAAVRHGSERGSVTLGGRRVPVRRPRVRAADGSGELPVSAYELFVVVRPGTTPVSLRSRQAVLPDPGAFLAYGGCVQIFTASPKPSCPPVAVVRPPDGHRVPTGGLIPLLEVR